MSESSAEQAIDPASFYGTVRNLESQAGVRLSDVERLLLVCDGTVTHMLEALTRESVDVVVLAQHRDGGTIDRRVRLETGTGQSLLWARSVIRLDELDDSVTDSLLEEDIGIGRALRKADVETRRVICGLSIYEPNEQQFPAFVPVTVGTLVARTYQIFKSDEPIMTIREYLPFGRF